MIGGDVLLKVYFLVKVNHQFAREQSAILQGRRPFTVFSPLEV